MSDNKKCSKTALVLYAFTSLVAITILTIALYKCDNRTCDNYRRDKTHSKSKSDYDTDFIPICLGPKGESIPCHLLKHNKKIHAKPDSHMHKHKKDNAPDLCLCAGSGKVCANKEKLLNSYLHGNTEYQNFAGIQKKLGGPFWKNTNFNQY